MRGPQASIENLLTNLRRMGAFFFAVVRAASDYFRENVGDLVVHFLTSVIAAVFAEGYVFRGRSRTPDQKEPSSDAEAEKIQEAETTTERLSETMVTDMTESEGVFRFAPPSTTTEEVVEETITEEVVEETTTGIGVVGKMAPPTTPEELSTVTPTTTETTRTTTEIVQTTTSLTTEITRPPALIPEFNVARLALTFFLVFILLFIATGIAVRQKQEKRY